MTRRRAALGPLLIKMDPATLPETPHELFAGTLGDGVILRALATCAGEGGRLGFADTDEESLIVVLSGRIELPDEAPVGPGGLLLTPDGAEPIAAAPGSALLRLVWRGDVETAGRSLSYRAVRSNPTGDERPRGPQIHARTRWLRRLHVHVSRVQPGGGYTPHRDAYAVMLVVLAGEIETLGGRIGVGGCAFAPAGTPHGLRSTGTAPATYLAIELHTPRIGSSPGRRLRRLVNGLRATRRLQYP